ncbi:MAG: glycosyltransferase family 39 protein [Planctomycetes bacterium]|nr:glycosyltransferase family 39 protein [Planctomycetota bacterium]
MAAEPARELFPVLQHSAAALAPLLVVLAVLPSLFAVVHRGTDETDAQWALWSLDVLSAARAGEAHLPDVLHPPGLGWHPPLGVWLTAGVQSIFGPSRPATTVAVSCLATVALVLAAFGFWKRVAGPRFAVWATAFLAMHPAIPLGASHPAPISLALLLAVVTLWALIAHLDDVRTLVSSKLLWAGFALGLCVLAGGPLSLAVLAIAAGTLAGWSALRLPLRRGGAAVRERRAAVRTSAPRLAAAVAVVALTGFAIGGWQPMRLAWHMEGPLWNDWMAGPPPAALEITDAEVPDEPQRFAAGFRRGVMALTAALSGLVLLGLWLGLRAVYSSATEEPPRATEDGRAPVLLLVWSSVASAAWLWALASSPEDALALALWRGFLVLPLTGLAALAAEAIAARAVSTGMAVAAAGFTLLVLLAGELQTWLEASRHRLLVVVLVLAAAALAARAVAVCRRRDSRRRAVLKLIILGHLAVTGWLALAAIDRPGDDQAALEAFGQELKQFDDVSGWTIVSGPEQPPLEIQLLVRRTWPRIEGVIVPSWDAALARALDAQPSFERPLAIVEWSRLERQPASLQIPGLEVRPVVRPHHFAGRPLRAFHVSARASELAADGDDRYSGRVLSSRRLRSLLMPSEVLIRVGHSPDPDDAFMFHALANGRIDTGRYRFVHELVDIETLNHRAQRGELELTAVSLHGYAYVTDTYALCACGASMGDDYGPMVVACEPMTVAELRGRRIAVPGTLTTAFLTLKLLLGDDFTYEVRPFDEILNHVAAGDVDAGLIIHEGQLTYGDQGLHLVVDLGHWWKEETGLPLPLGANAIRRDLGRQTMEDVTALLKASIQYGLDHREEALAHALQYGRDLDETSADVFVGMYVNDWTLDFGPEGRRAVRELLRRGHAAGIIPRPVELEFVG